MDTSQISRDDLIDVHELTQKIELHILRITAGHDPNIAISSLISGSINALISKCDCLENVLTFTNVFVTVLQDVTKKAIEASKDD